MSLIKSISGIRGTIGGAQGNNLTPLDIVKFTSGYARFLQLKNPGKKLHVCVGRDARISGSMVNNLVAATLNGMGIDVTDLGLSTTPTVEIAVPELNTDGGIILTASHNPKQWNALKLLNAAGEFLNKEEGEKVIELSEAEIEYAPVDELGCYTHDDTWINKHIENVLKLQLVDAEAIRNAGFRIAIDAVNSTGGIAIPALLKALGVAEVHELYCTPDGHFPHNPEPLPENLGDISALIKKEKLDAGFVVDPDVDRLAIVSENGEMFGEEYTLVAVSDYVLQHTGGNTVSNLSSTRALRDVTNKAGFKYTAAAVGEVNVVAAMKETSAVIGGEGNGGIIYPEIHYGRDALVGIALFLTHLAKSGMKCSELRASYPAYFISKNKIELAEGTDVDGILAKMSEKYASEQINTIDGVKIDFAESWVHMRKSNTEPIIRIYAEAKSQQEADALAGRMINDISLVAE